MRLRRIRFLTLLSVLLHAAPCAAQLFVSPDKPSGVYGAGETVHWTIKWTGKDKPPSAHYVLKIGGLKEAGQGDLVFSDNIATLQTTFESPGTLVLEVKSNSESKPLAVGGAVADPEKITPAAPAPDDFETFWKARLDELAQIPPNPRLDAAVTSGSGVTYQKITLDNIRGTQIHGQIARPDKGDKFPALLILQWAGVYPLQKNWVIDRAAEGWLALNILPHDLPIDAPEAFYKEQFAGPLKNYWSIGNDDARKSYYLRMYLSCYRAVEYLRSREDWDGKTLVVMGTSQGGQQALVVAGLHPDGITAVLPFLPAACDVLAPDVGRASGFPHWYNQVQGKDPQKVRAAGRYFDPVNFARRIKCPVLIGLALRDDLAPPSSVLAAANVIAAPKEIVILPNAGHQDEHGSQKPYNERCYGAWLPALRQGQPPPIQANQLQTRSIGRALPAATSQQDAH